MIFKKFISIGLVFALSFGICTTVFANNVNEEQDDYVEIHNADELNYIRKNLNGKYILSNHIDLSSLEIWNPIGSKESPFTGILNGNGFTIVNIKSHNGLFGYIDGAKIENVGLINCNLTCSTLSKVVGIIANYSNNSTIVNCFTTGEISSSTDSSLTAIPAEYTSGCLVGFASNSFFKNCYSLSKNILNYEKTPFAQMGGLVGVAENSQFVCCYNSGEVSAIKPTKSNSSDSNIQLGDLVGLGNSNNIFVSCYESQNSIQPVGNILDPIEGISTLSEEEMLLSNSFLGFDFDNDWYIKDSISPRLVIEKPLFNTEINMHYKEKISPVLYGNLIISEWCSDETEVAVVTDNEIEAVGTGETKIKILTKDNLYAEIKVNVKYTWWQSIIMYIFLGWLWY